MAKKKVQCEYCPRKITGHLMDKHMKFKHPVQAKSSQLDKDIAVAKEILGEEATVNTFIDEEKAMIENAIIDINVRLRSLSLLQMQHIFNECMVHRMEEMHDQWAELSFK